MCPQKSQALQACWCTILCKIMLPLTWMWSTSMYLLQKYYLMYQILLDLCRSHKQQSNCFVGAVHFGVTVMSALKLVSLRHKKPQNKYKLLQKNGFKVSRDSFDGTRTTQQATFTSSHCSFFLFLLSLFRFVKHFWLFPLSQLEQRSGLDLTKEKIFCIFVYWIQTSQTGQQL